MKQRLEGVGVGKMQYTECGYKLPHVSGLCRVMSVSVDSHPAEQTLASSCLVRRLQPNVCQFAMQLIKSMQTIHERWCQGKREARSYSFQRKGDHPPHIRIHVVSVETASQPNPPDIKSMTLPLPSSRLS